MSQHVHPGLVEHAWVDKAFHVLLDAVDHPGTGDVAALLHSLSDLLRAHLGAEELDIAKFADVEPEDAKALLQQHEAFRTALDELAAQSKAGNLQASDVHKLKLRVSLHEGHEETGLYRWIRAR
ncbi:MAG TPA: hemerythrin domain-containing protein [Labilithrix sp.]|nr:hemerythrin domain-containing protein [Labilithrix sp.]